MTDHREEHHDPPPGAALAFRRYFGAQGPWRSWTQRVRGGSAALRVLALSLALVISLAWGLGQQQARASADLAMEMARQRAFEQLVSRTQTIEILLAKGLITSAGGAGSLVFTDLWYHGLAAQEDLSELPLDHVAIANSARFMTQVADFGRYLVRQCVLQRPLTEEDWSTLALMHEAAAELATQLTQLSAVVNGGGFRWASLAGISARRTEEVVSRVRTSFGDIAEHMQDLPTLIYDGPFSDHIDTREPRGLPAQQVTLEQAQEIAKRFAPALPGAAEGACDITHVGDVAGRVPAYSFALNPRAAQASPGATAQGRTQPERLAAGPEVRIDVAQQGGYVTYMLVYGIEGVDGGDPEQFPAAGAWYTHIPVIGRLLAQAQVPPPVPWPTPEQQQPPGEAPPPVPGDPAPELPQAPTPPQGELPPGGPPGPDSLSLVQAVEHARSFLARRGFGDMTATFTDLEQGVATCQFVATQDGILLYPDQVKVKVRLGDGQILGFEGMDYLMSHVQRDLPAPTLSAAEARTKINPRLDVIGERLVVIPTPALGEVLCWELHVLYDGAAFLVYINALTGDEEAIFKLIDQGSGSQLVM